MTNKHADVSFAWNGEQYEAGCQVSTHNYIVLPDRQTILFVHAWTENAQPKLLIQEEGLDPNTLIKVFGEGIVARKIEAKDTVFRFHQSFYSVQEPTEAIKIYVLPDKRVVGVIWKPGWVGTQVVREITAQELAAELHTEVATFIPTQEILE